MAVSEFALSTQRIQKTPKDHILPERRLDEDGGSMPQNGYGHRYVGVCSSTQSESLYPIINCTSHPICHEIICSSHQRNLPHVFFLKLASF